MNGSRDVVMYSTGWCPYCLRAKALLDRKGVAFIEIKVDENPAERAAMLSRTSGQRTVPQIFVGDRHVGGFDDLYALDKAGELDKLLGRA